MFDPAWGVLPGDDESSGNPFDRAVQAWQARTSEPPGRKVDVGALSEMCESPDVASNAAEKLSGVKLVAALDALDLDELSPGELIDAVALWDRVVSFAQARRGQAAARFEGACGISMVWAVPNSRNAGPRPNHAHVLRADLERP